MTSDHHPMSRCVCTENAWSHVIVTDGRHGNKLLLDPVMKPPKWIKD